MEDREWSQTESSLFSLQILDQIQVGEPQPDSVFFEECKLENIISSQHKPSLMEMAEPSKGFELKQEGAIVTVAEQAQIPTSQKESTKELTCSDLNKKVSKGFEKLHLKVSTLIQDLEDKQKSNYLSCRSSTNRLSDCNMSINNVLNVQLKTQQNSEQQSCLVSYCQSPRNKIKVSSLKKNLSAIAFKNSFKGDQHSQVSSAVKMKSINLLKASNNPVNSQQVSRQPSRSKSKGLTLTSAQKELRKQIIVSPKIHLTHVQKKTKKNKGNKQNAAREKPLSRKNTVNLHSFFSDRRVNSHRVV